jgi:hypothetical protein
MTKQHGGRSVFLVKLGSWLVFTELDLRKYGCTDLVESVTLLSDPNGDSWHDGDTWPDQHVGTSPDDETSYRIFRNGDELRDVGFTPVAGRAIEVDEWHEFLKVRDEIVACIPD